MRRSVEKRVNRPRMSSETFGWSIPRTFAATVCVSRRARSARAMSAASSDFARASAGSATSRSSNTLPVLLVTGGLVVVFFMLAHLRVLVRISRSIRSASCSRFSTSSTSR